MALKTMLHLPVQKRDTKVKAKKVLEKGYVPGVVYGPKISPIPVSVQRKTLFEVYDKAGETTLIALDFEGVKNDKETEENVVLIRDTQMHPINGQFTHVDFYQLRMDQPIEISVPVEHINEAPAVKDFGGVLVQNLHEIDIKALPKDLIHEITVDLSRLEKIDDAITVKDLGISSAVEILADLEEVVFAIEAPEEEAVEVVEEEIATEGDKIAEIVTEGEEKRAEEAAKEAAEE